MCDSIHCYRFQFAKSSQYLIKFMQVFDIEAHISLHCLIHELDCGTECKYTHAPTLFINGFHWHVINNYKYGNRTLHLELPYQYSFDGVDDDVMYQTLKYNDSEDDYETCHSDSIDIDYDYECIEFTVTYYDEQVPFDVFLENEGLGLDIYFIDDDEILTEEGTYWCLNHELEEQCVTLELDENSRFKLKIET